MLTATVKKEALLLWRDRGALASLFLLPLAFMTFLGFIFRGTDASAPRKLVVVDDGAATTEAFVGALETTGAFALAKAPEARARELVKTGQADAALLVPAEEAEDRQSPYRLLMDGGTPLAVRASVQAIVSAVVARMAAEPACRTPPEDLPLRVEDVRGAGAPLRNADGFQVSVPGNVVLFGFFIAVTLGISFIEERKSGTWRRLLVAPVHPGAHLLGKMLTYLLIGILQMVFLFAVGRGVLGMRLAGSAFAVALVCLAVVLCAVCLGLFVASVGRSARTVGALTSVVLLVLGMLGGAMIPRALMPESVRALGLFTPHGWALDALQMLVLVPGSGLADVARPLLVLLAFSAGFALLGWWRFPLRDG